MWIQHKIQHRLLQVDGTKDSSYPVIVSIINFIYNCISLYIKMARSIGIFVIAPKLNNILNF